MIKGSPQWPMDVFVFQKACMRRPVGIYQAVEAEVAVMLQFSVIASVPVHGFSILSHPLENGVITPFPDKTAAQGRILLCQVKIFLKVTGTVAH